MKFTPPKLHQCFICKDPLFFNPVPEMIKYKWTWTRAICIGHMTARIKNNIVSNIAIVLDKKITSQAIWFFSGSNIEGSLWIIDGNDQKTFVPIKEKSTIIPWVDIDPDNIQETIAKVRTYNLLS